MRAMMVLVIGMGVLIVVGVGVVGVTIMHRMGGARGPSPMVATGAAGFGDVVLGEPAGTHILGVTLSGDRIGVVLQGGGADRVDILDAADGRRVGRIVLAH